MSEATEMAELIAGRLEKRWLPEIYARSVRTQRTRSHKIEVPVRENNAEIIFTLLGIELKVGRRRFACPDLATARYMRVFARVGVGEFAIPYDITRISAVADDMEIAWHATLSEIKNAAKGLTGKLPGRVRSAVIGRVRRELLAAGAGERMPEFKRSTKQRTS